MKNSDFKILKNIVNYEKIEIPFFDYNLQHTQREIKLHNKLMNLDSKNFEKYFNSIFISLKEVSPYKWKRGNSTNIIYLRIDKNALAELDNCIDIYTGSFNFSGTQRQIEKNLRYTYFIIFHHETESTFLISQIEGVTIPIQFDIFQGTPIEFAKI